MTKTPAIGYLVPEFPGQTHAFFWRELTALEAQGQPVQCLSTRRPPDAACPHAFGPAARARTLYLFPPRPGALGLLLRRPLRSLRALGHALRLDESPWRDRLRVAALLPSAADLVRHAGRLGLRHIHVHSCANAAHLAAMAALLGGPSYSLTLHGDLPVYGRDHRAKMRGARFVSAVTRALAAEIARVAPGIPNPVIWMGVDTARFRPDPARRAAQDPAFTLVTVARLHPAKGHAVALQSMAMLVAEGLDLRYRIAGEGPARAAIEAEIARLGLRDRVELLGAIDEAAVLALLQGADALALTSTGQGEAAPVAVMEAMACGLPVVASVIGGTPDMIADGTDGFLVPQGDVAAVAAAFRRLAGDPALRIRVAAAARETAQREFDHKSNAARLGAKIRQAQA